MTLITGEMPKENMSSPQKIELSENESGGLVAQRTSKGSLLLSRSSKLNEYLRLSSVWLGRPVNFREGDFTVNWPEIEYDEEHEKWGPYPADAFGPDFVAEPGRALSCYQEQAKLCD